MVLVCSKDIHLPLASLITNISHLLCWNAENGVWTKAATTGVGPSPRFSLAGDVVDSDRGILLFIGGCNENLEALDDMYYLDTGTQYRYSITTFCI